MRNMKRRKEMIAEAIHHGGGITLTDEEKAWMDKRPERHIRKANDGKDFAVLSYNPAQKEDEAMAERIADKVKASGGHALAFLIDDDI